MSNYAKIRQFAQNKKAMKGMYKGKERHLWPMVVGKTDKPEGAGPGKDEIALCYQFYVADTNPQPEPAFRCFKVATFVGDVQELTAPSTSRPRELTAKELKRQNAVLEREVPPP